MSDSQKGTLLKVPSIVTLKFKMLYDAFRSIALSNPGISEDRIVTIFDQNLKRLAIRTENEPKHVEDILDLMFKNADMLLSETKGKMASDVSDYDFKDWEISNAPAWIIESISSRARVGLNDSFCVNSEKVTGIDLVNFLVDSKVTHIPLYVKLLASLIMRTIYQDNAETRFLDFQDFICSIQYESSQKILGRFCIHNYVEWLSNYLDDKQLYSYDTGEMIKRMVETDNYNSLIHGFGNANFS